MAASTTKLTRPIHSFGSLHFTLLHFIRTSLEISLRSAQTKDPLMITAFVCIVITIVMAYPLNIFPSRYTIEVILARWAKRRENSANNEEHRRLVGGSKGGSGDGDSGYGIGNGNGNGYDEQGSNDGSFVVVTEDDFDYQSMKPLGSRSRHFIITLLISGSSLAIALLVEDVNVVFGLMGSTCSAFVCFVLPGCFALTLDLCEGRKGMKIGVWLITVGGFLVGCLSTGVTLWGLVYPGEKKPDFCDNK